MSFPTKTDFSGLARTGLEIVANANGATNQNLEVPNSQGAIQTSHQFGHVKNPTVEFKITADFTLNGSSTQTAAKVALGKVHYTLTSGAASYALKTLSATSGAGEEPTFSVELVQIEDGASQTKNIYHLDAEDFTPARHAQTYGAFTFEEDDDLTLQHCELTYDCELDPTTINGTPKASDACKAFKQVVATMWTDDDSTPPDVEIEDGFVLVSDWACTGSDGQLFVWTATFKKYLTPYVPTQST